VSPVRLRQIATSAAIAGALVAAGALSAWAKAPELSKPDYVGTVPELFKGRVLLELKPDGKRPKHGSFEARQIEVVCGDDDLANRNFRPLRIQFHSPREFQGTRYTTSPSSTERYLSVEGHLAQGGRARGYIMFFSNSPDPDEPDCSFNAGALLWKATRR